MKFKSICNIQVNYGEIIIKWSQVFKHVLNISIYGVFEKDIKLFEKNNTNWSDSYDEYDWCCGHHCGDTKDG